jgi:hypothetical protein
MPSSPSPAAATPLASMIVLGPDFADTALKFLGGAFALVAHGVTKVPYQECERILGFSEIQRKTMTPALAPVLDKYLGEWIRTHQAEMALILLATPIVTANVMTFAAVAREHKRKTREEKARATRAAEHAAPAEQMASPADSPAPPQVM